MHVQGPATTPVPQKEVGRGNTFSLSFLSILTCPGQHCVLSQVTQGSTHPRCSTTPPPHHSQRNKRRTFPWIPFEAKEKMFQKPSWFLLGPIVHATIRPISILRETTETGIKLRVLGDCLPGGPDISRRTQRERMND